METTHGRLHWPQSGSSIQVQIPRGRHTVRIGTYNPRTMFPAPALKRLVPYQFTMFVVEPVISWDLKVRDIESMLLTVQMQKIMEAFRNEPNDSQVVDIWIEKQRAVKWQEFKKRCVKEARLTVKMERQMLNGLWPCRTASIPKPIKEHKLYPALTQRTYANG